MRTPTRFLDFKMAGFGFILALFLTTACNGIDPIEEVSESGFALKEGGGAEGPCSGEIAFTPSFTLVSVSGYPGYDFALQITGTAPEVPQGCTCGVTTYTVNLNLDYYYVKAVALASSADQANNVEVVYEDEEGFLLKFRAPQGWNSVPEQVDGQGSSAFSVCVDSQDGDIILFDFYGGALSPNLIDNVGGICIIDNIDKSLNR